MKPRHEAFAQGLARGMTADAAYKAAGYKPHRGNAARMSANESIVARVAEIRAEAAEEAKMTKREALRFLEDVVRTPIGSVHKDHPLCQEWSRTDSESSSTVRYKMPSKLDAIKQLAVMCGWNEPEKHEVKHIGLAEIVADIVGKK